MSINIHGIDIKTKTEFDAYHILCSHYNISSSISAHDVGAFFFRSFDKGEVGP